MPRKYPDKHKHAKQTLQSPLRTPSIRKRLSRIQMVSGLEEVLMAVREYDNTFTKMLASTSERERAAFEDKLWGHGWQNREPGSEGLYRRCVMAFHKLPRLREEYRRAFGIDVYDDTAELAKLNWRKNG